MTWYAIRRRVALTVLALLLAAPVLAAGPEIRVLDGDTIKIGKVNYRLHGIDAPEKTQHCQRDNLDWLCGQEAAAHLRGLIAGRPVTCTEKDRDRYGRVVAVCEAGGIDLNRAMVRAGLAWAYLAYSRDYEAAEWEAQLLGNGDWAASVRAEPAWDWRRQKRRKPANDTAADAARIRG
jgi:endonuclease YncB( thermonuclease family)